MDVQLKECMESKTASVQPVDELDFLPQSIPAVILQDVLKDVGHSLVCDT